MKPGQVIYVLIDGRYREGIYISRGRGRIRARVDNVEKWFPAALVAEQPVLFQ